MQAGAFSAAPAEARRSKRRVVFLTTASSPKPPWIAPIPPLPPERERSVLKVSASPYRSFTRSPSARSSSSSTCRALIVVPRAAQGVVDPTFYDDTVSLHTRLAQPAPPRATAQASLKVAPPASMDDASLAAPQHQLISEARPVLSQPIPNDTTCRLPTQTSTANVYSYSPPQTEFSTTNYLQDLDDIPTLFGESHDEYSLFNDFTDYNNTPMMNPTTIPDPFVESATVPATFDPMTTISATAAAPARAISSEEDILANVDLCDLETDVDIGQLMRYLQDDTVEVPGFEENIFERVEQEPTTPETVGEPVGSMDYFAVPSTSSYRSRLANAQELDPVQEFFPEMCVELSTNPGYDVYDKADCPEWQPYAQYSPSHTPVSTTSSGSSTSYSNFQGSTSRKRPYPATSTSPIYDDFYRAKRDKNNVASAVSRQKHKDKVEREKREVNELATRNEKLKMEVETLEQQIATMRAVLMDSIGSAQK